MDARRIQLSDLVLKCISDQYIKKKILIYVSTHESIDVNQTLMSYFYYFSFNCSYFYTSYLILYQNHQGVLLRKNCIAPQTQYLAHSFL